MARVLITGGAGFIGSHVARKLLDLGMEVVIFDMFHQYVFPIQRTFLENMQYRFEVLLKGAEIIRGSTRNKDELRRNINAIHPDLILHLAALPLANIALRQTEEAFDSIVLGTVNILEILRDGPGIDKFIYVSSSMVYGDFAQTPMPENGEKRPKEIYGGMKLAGEIMTQVFSQRYDIPFAIVRPSAVYGPTDNNRRVVQIFIEQAIQRRPIVASNPETTFLDFTYVEDVAEGLVRVTLEPNAVNEVFNITRGEGQSLADLIEILREHFPDLEVRIDKEAQSYRPSRGALDITKAIELTGYKPRYSLRDGVSMYIQFVRTFNPSLQGNRAHE